MTNDEFPAQCAKFCWHFIHRAAISCIRETASTIYWAGLSGNGPEVQISQGKSFNGGSFNGNEEEGKKEKALTASET